MPLAPLAPDSLDAGAVYCFGDGRLTGAFGGRKPTTQKAYRDGYEAFRRYATSLGLDPAANGWERLPPDLLAAFYRWCLDHRQGGLGPRTAATYAHAIAALLRQLRRGRRLSPSLDLDALRDGLREALVRGDYVRRTVDPRIASFVRWVDARPVPPRDGRHDQAYLEALRGKALVRTLFARGIRREKATKLETAKVLWSEHPGEADLRGKTRAAVAVGHTILVIADYLLTRGAAYEDLGMTYFDQRDRVRVERRLVRRLEALGYTVELQPCAA